jgi:cell division protein FtsQ
MNDLRRLLLGLLVLTILVAPVIAVLSGRIGGQHWQMKRLQVSAPFEFVSQSQIQNAVAGRLKGGFFAVDLTAINQDLKALHWVEKVEVRKQWPDTLVVQIKEYRPLAIWNGRQMLAEQGSVFVMPDTKLPELPRFTGNALQAQEMVTFYHTAQPLFQSIGLRIRALTVSDRNAWRVELSDGMVIEIGRNDIVSRLNRFVALLPKIKRDDARRLVHADLRYTNGFALTWQAVTNTPAGHAMPAPTEAMAI